jgi:predicted RNase H-like HicB family nuclease
MRNVPTVLRCYARPEADHYLAFCLELGLCDRGETLEAAKASLEEDILGYLESLTPENLDGLFPRPAPWYVYVDYYRVWCLVALARFSHQIRHRWLVFVEPLVLTPRLAHGAVRP